MSGGINTLRVNTGMAVDGAGPPSVNALFEMQNLACFRQEQRKMVAKKLDKDNEAIFNKLK